LKGRVAGDAVYDRGEAAGRDEDRPAGAGCIAGGGAAAGLDLEGFESVVFLEEKSEHLTLVVS
jgi:hypothetical protein